jgi:3-oxoacyl-[acyl-carrier-protein] synthase II
MEGRSGTAEIKAFDASDLPVRIAAELPEFDPTDYMSQRNISRTDRFTQVAVGAASLAWDEASGSELDVKRERIGVIVGTGIGGLSTIEKEHTNLMNSGPRRVSPFMVPKLMPNAAAGARYRYRGSDARISPRQGPRARFA